MSKLKKYGIAVATIVTALYVVAGGAAKLAGVEHVHHSFAVLGLPAWFGYFIGVCEILGAVALFIRPLAAISAAGLGFIMLGALFYHVNYTPLVQAIPAFILFLLCGYIFNVRRKKVLDESFN